MGPSATIQHIRHIAAQGLGARLAIPAMVDAMERLIPSRTRTFMWLDDDGNQTDMYEQQPIPEAIEAMIAAGPELAADPHAPSTNKMAQSPFEYGGWRVFEHFPGWDKSMLKNEIFRRYGIGNNLDFPLRQGRKTRAILAFGREPGSSSYTRREVEAMLGLRAHFLHALDCVDVTLSIEQAATPDDPQILLVEPDGRIETSSPTAKLLLSQLAGAWDGRNLVNVTSAPASLRELMRRLDLAEEGRNAQPPSQVISTPWGTIKVIAHQRTAGGEYVISLHRLVPRALARIRKAAFLDLSPREREVAVAMCTSANGEAIAQLVGLSPASYREYARRIYGRLGVEGRIGVKDLLDS
ncbi:hypothetical protein [Novosphingobium sp.]|uniref:hypothetical protein n=1 Tax=Novosphingobium sp. TaxID=1874826 RepID=UPI0025DE0511|nr:hypothetical protein [Novosphingobium sp.]MCC6924915.1 hypothetical protein [Novosphingobium sp.]